MDTTSTDTVDALAEVARGLRDLAAALDTLARKASPHKNVESPQKGGSIVDPDVARVARLLYNRLGEGNRDFIRAFAIEFQPGEDFSLDEIARAAKVEPQTARARLMNIGRSLKALGARDLLWEAMWMEDDGVMSYQWTYEGHKAVLQEFK